MAQFIGSTIRRLSAVEVDRIRKQYPNHSNPKWITEGEFSWLHKGDYINVPKGFVCDGSSGGPDLGHSFLIHDWLYATHTIGDRIITRQEADQIMIDILKWERASMYAIAVATLTKLNPFWAFSRAWANSKGARIIEEEVSLDD